MMDFVETVKNSVVEQKTRDEASQIETLIKERDALQEQLAASQARERVLWNALETTDCFVPDTDKTSALKESNDALLNTFSLDTIRKEDKD